MLGRDDIGALAPGMRADVALWDVSGIEAAGSWDAAAILLAGPARVKHSFIDGRHIVRDGRITTIDLPRLLSDQRRLARDLMDMA